MKLDSTVPDERIIDIWNRRGENNSLILSIKVRLPEVVEMCMSEYEPQMVHIEGAHLEDVLRGALGWLASVGTHGDFDVMFYLETEYEQVDIFLDEEYEIKRTMKYDDLVSYLEDALEGCLANSRGIS